MPSEVNVAMMRPLKGPVGNRGFFALVMVVLLLALNTMALIGPYHLALADWHAARDIVAQAPDIQSEDNEK